VLHSYCSGAIFGQPRGEAPFGALALHGWSRDHHDFDQLFLDEPPSGLSALAIDLPGFGASPPPETAWGSAEYAEALTGLFDLLVARPILIGHSFGGRVALQFAARYPDRIGGLVLGGVPLVTNPAPSRTPRGFRVVKTLARHRLVAPQVLERARRRYGSSDYLAAEGVMREVLVRSVNEQYEPLMSKVTTHVELVLGANDTAAPVALERRAVEFFRDVNLTVVEHIGHMIPLEAPQELRMAVERCLT